VALVHRGRFVESGPRDRVLTPERLQEVFGIRAEVLATSDGQPAYVFHKRERLVIRD
jgi:ABC-type cobalamin/Fe3+-siderophores transport system ATPase subunit